MVLKTSKINRRMICNCNIIHVDNLRCKRKDRDKPSVRGHFTVSDSVLHDLIHVPRARRIYECFNILLNENMEIVRTLL